MSNFPNKIIYGSQVLIDLTSDTAEADKVLSGYTFHDMTGEVKTGTCNYDANTNDATALASEVLLNKTGYVRGSKVTGTMPNNGQHTSTISALNQQASIPKGYHDGSGYISLDTTEKAKIIGNNIRNGVTILGVVGTMQEDSENPQTGMEVTPSSTSQSITPGTGFTCFREVTVKAIPYAEVPNSAGGITVTIG